MRKKSVARKKTSAPKKPAQTPQEKKRSRLQRAQVQMHSFHRFLTGVFEARSLTDLEQKIQDTLQPTLELSWTRIVLETSKDSLLLQKAQDAFSVIDVEVPTQFKWKSRWILARTKEQPWNKQETEAVQQMAEIVALCMGRLFKLEQAEHLKRQWETTFDAIKHPMCLTDSHERIMRWNKSFRDLAGTGNQDLTGRSIAGLITKAKNHRMQKQTLQLDDQTLFLFMFYDMTERQRLERQMIDSSKLVELGTIGSSIAHELNNPIGGVLSFIQLIKMDLPKNHPHFADLLEMEKGTLRCRDIVHSLLDFSRAGADVSGSPEEVQKLILETLKIKDYSKPR